MLSQLILRNFDALQLNFAIFSEPWAFFSKISQFSPDLNPSRAEFCIFYLVFNFHPMPGLLGSPTSPMHPIRLSLTGTEPFLVTWIFLSDRTANFLHFQVRWSHFWPILAFSDRFGPIFNQDEVTFCKLCLFSLLEPEALRTGEFGRFLGGLMSTVLISIQFYCKF